MIRESFITLVSRVALFLVGLASSVTIARVLGPEGRGIVALLTTIGALMSVVGNLGISASNVYFGAGRPELGRNLAWMSLVVGCAVGGILMLVMGVLPYLMPGLTRGVDPRLLLLYGVNIPLGLMAAHLTGLLWGMHRVVAANLLGALAAVATLLGYLLLLVPAKTVTVAIIAQLAGQFVALAGLVWYVHRQVNLRLSGLRIQWPVLWDSIAYGLKAQAGNVLQFLNYRLDMLLVNLFLGPTDLGYYAVAVSMTEVIWMPTNSLALVIFPKVSAKQVTDRAQVDIAAAARLGLLLSALLGGTLALAAPLLIRLLFGEAFLPALQALYWLLAGTIIFCLANVLASFTAGKGYPQYGTIAAAVSLPVTIGLDLLLIPRFGIAGAALASTLAYVTATAVLVKQAQRLGAGSLRELLIVTRNDWSRMGTLAQRILSLGKAGVSDKV